MSAECWIDEVPPLLSLVRPTDLERDGEQLEEAPKPQARPEESWVGPDGAIELIMARADEPWVSIGLGAYEVARVRAGGTVTLSGPSGGGKSSLASCLTLNHARHHGWALVLSRELSTDEMAGRMVGIETETGWQDVLTGKLSPEQMRAALPNRLRIVSRRGATLVNLEQELMRLRDDIGPDEPIMFVADYGQIMAVTSEDTRQGVGEVWDRCDDLARRYRAVGLVLSQMSRVNSRAARHGERLGADALDGGAESSAIERFSTVVLEIGGMQPADEHGCQRASLSVAKGRMGGGDKVFPMAYTGRTGRWVIMGDSRPASEVRAEATAQRQEGKVEAARLAMIGFAESSAEPVSRADLRRAAQVGAALAKSATDEAIELGELVAVQRKPPRSPHWLLWTPRRAAEQGIPLVVETAGGGR